MPKAATQASKKHKLHVIDIAPKMVGLSHGQQTKTMFVCHETVSPNTPGMGDINSVLQALRNQGYGIHAMTDKDGHKCWAKGDGRDIFYHAGDVNGVAVGCENVSEIPALIQSHQVTKPQALQMWFDRTEQLSALALLIACWHNQAPRKHPLRRSDGRIESPGVCSHWDVSQHYASAGGHWDCQPSDKGGHFPLQHVLDLAKQYAKAYTF